MKKILLMLTFVALTAFQHIPQPDRDVINLTQNQEVAPCSNGFDDINVCELKS